jgi:hypothetical protein
MRTLASFDHHLEHTVGKCCRSWISLGRTTLLGDEYLVTPHLCKSNYCPVCRKKNLLSIRKQLFNAMKGRRWRLVTLTFPDHSKDVLTTLRNLYRQYKRFIQRVRRAYPDISFVRTIEIHQSGFPHIHMVVDTFVPIAFLRKHWQDVGGGIVDITSGQRQSKIKKPAGYKQAARYLTEELEKRVQDPHRLGAIFWQASCKSITTSRNLQMTSSSGEWQFKGAHPTLEDAMYHYEWLKYSSRYNGTPTPGVHIGKDSFFIAPGVHNDLEN